MALDYDEFIFTDKDFRELMSNREALKKPLEKFLDNIIDEITLGIIFEVHKLHRTRGLDDDSEASTSSVLPYKTPGVVDIFGYENLKKIQYSCDCPICDRVVSAVRFATHLAKCMGMGRRKNPSRNAATHSIISISSNNSSNSNNSTKEKEEDSTYSSMHSDDGDDDDEWNSKQKKRKKKHKNKSKKGKGTPKKGSSLLSDLDALNVDVEGDDEGDIMLRDIIQDNSNQSSPADSVSSSNASIKKREKSSSKKKNKRDRTSPNMLID